MWLTLSLYHGMVWFDFIVCNIQQAQYKPWLTHLPMDKKAAILANDIFKCVFLNQYFIIPIQVSLIFVPMSPVCQRPRPRLLANLSNTASGLGYGWISTSIWISRMYFTHSCILLISLMAVSSNCRWTMACVFNMMASSNGNIFARYWPFVRGIHRSPFPSQRPVTWSFGVFFDLRLKKRLSKQSRRWWFGTPSCSLWRHCND